MTSTNPTEEALGPQEEIRHHFVHELDDIRTTVVEMGTMVVANIERAGIAVTENRLEDIEAIREADRPINERYHSCEARVFEVLALQQPVASDLRFLVATTRILYEIERSGDLAVNLVKALEHIDGMPTDPATEALLARLAEASALIFRNGITAIATMDPEIGRRADKDDDAVDELTADLYQAVSERQQTLGLDVAVALYRMGRFFERIADHGVNIAENVTFIVTARWPHTED